MVENMAWSEFGTMIHRRLRQNFDQAAAPLSKRLATLRVLPGVALSLFDKQR
jgi:hypothetical protein